MNSYLVCDKFLGTDWNTKRDKIVYGYCVAKEGSKDYLDAIRHCWLYFDGDYIDITPGAIESLNNKYDYIPFKELDVIKYISLIESNDGYPSLDKVLSKDEEKLSKVLKSGGWHTDTDFLNKSGVTTDEFNAMSSGQKEALLLREVLGFNN